ncbi:hypothetical protein EON82_04685 [bacterium]|nr:MAG: hypothetical protein EON82_04685 [bacterium]
MEHRTHERYRPGGSQLSRDHGPVGLAIEWSPRGVVAYDARTRSTIVGEDIASMGLSGREAVLALSRRGVFVRTTRVPNASPAEVRAILMMQAGELFPLPTIDLAWDFVLTDDISDEGRLAVLAAVPSADLRRALDAATAAGIRVKAAVPLAFGSTLIAHDLGLSDAAVVERSEDGTSVDVIANGVLRASRATPPSAPLDLEVPRALQLAGVESAPAVAAGGALLTNATRETEHTALRAIAEAPLDRLKLRVELPEAVAARVTAAARRSVRTALMAAVVAGLLAVFVALEFSDAAAAAQAARSKSNARLQRLRNEEKKVNAERARYATMKESLDLAFAPPQKISEVVAVTTVSVPTGTWLKNLTIERGRPLSLRGTARNESLVADLVRRLDKNPESRFRDVQITNASNTLVNKVPVTDFVLTAFPVGNLPFVARTGASRGR